MHRGRSGEVLVFVPILLIVLFALSAWSGSSSRRKKDDGWEFQAATQFDYCRRSLWRSPSREHCTRGPLLRNADATSSSLNNDPRPGPSYWDPISLNSYLIRSILTLFSFTFSAPLQAVTQVVRHLKVSWFFPSINNNIHSTCVRGKHLLFFHHGVKVCCLLLSALKPGYWLSAATGSSPFFCVGPKQRLYSDRAFYD